MPEDSGVERRISGPHPQAQPLNQHRMRTLEPTAIKHMTLLGTS